MDIQLINFNHKGLDQDYPQSITIKNNKLKITIMDFR